MIEREPHDEEDISGRLIPEIPGVLPSDEDEGWDDLTEEPEEESEEDLLDEINREVRNLLTSYGVEGINGVPQADILRLWERMDMDSYLISDLILFSIINTRQLFKDDLKQPRFRDLQDRSEVTENPYDIRLKLIEEVAPNLQRLGYGQLKSYRLPRDPDEDLARAFKVEGWLAGLSFMEDLPARLKSERAGTSERKLPRAKVFGVTLEEIIRQARIAESDETKRLYDIRLASNQEAYDQLLKNIKNAYQIANVAFSKYIKR